MSDSSTSDSSQEEPWIVQYVTGFGKDFFVEVAPEFIEDDFNLTGLSSCVPYYKEALDLILDLEPEVSIAQSDVALIEHAAELLYGLIHARYIITKQGMIAMAKKYENNCFGSCPRYYCEGTHMLPIGRFDSPGYETVRLYCPNCNDIYLPSSSRYLNTDGAFFGTSFAGLFMKMFPEVNKSHEFTQNQYQLKLFGFKLNEKATCGPRMQWLRSWPRTQNDMYEYKKCEFSIADVKKLKALDYQYDDLIREEKEHPTIIRSEDEGSDSDDNNNDGDDDEDEDDEDEDMDIDDNRRNNTNVKNDHNNSGGESMMSIV
ncbi:hypothetical protein CANINC_002505 [Pichia inconspicua]|uniref:Casein kinase II subunit beta n=1 Tax=Pichia inconspicua TaxID=52247 RepID=A0A4V4NFP1_9ASCO|nr:hypothetical protein CANINC_002505 [[Candida] inconspicua]